MTPACDFDTISQTCKRIPTASTLAHVDSADACNVLCHVADNGYPDWKIRGMCEHLLVDEKQIADVLATRATRKIGAIWHIFHPKHSEKIRELIQKQRRADKYGNGFTALSCVSVFIFVYLGWEIWETC